MWPKSEVVRETDGATIVGTHPVVQRQRAVTGCLSSAASTSRHDTPVPHRTLICSASGPFRQIPGANFRRCDRTVERQPLIARILDTVASDSRFSCATGDAGASPFAPDEALRPRSRRGLVPRPRLTERLDRGGASTLMIVSAPAGFGKTTLLVEWLTAGSAIPNSERVAAWLSLDKGDNDPVTFWTYLVAALQTVAPGVGRDTLTLLHEPQPSAVGRTEPGSVGGALYGSVITHLTLCPFRARVQPQRTALRRLNPRSVLGARAERTDRRQCPLTRPIFRHGARQKGQVGTE